MASRVEAGKNTSTVARAAEGDEKGTQCLGYNWATLSLGAPVLQVSDFLQSLQTKAGILFRSGHDRLLPFNAMDGLSYYRLYISTDRDTVTCISDYRRGFTDHLQVVTTNNCNTVADFHTTNHPTLSLLSLLTLFFTW
jgi:hypothetical protein